jgi:hypothetical protein
MNTLRSRASTRRRHSSGSRPSRISTPADANVPAITCSGTACASAIISRSAQRWIVSAALVCVGAGGSGFTSEPSGAVTVSGAHRPALAGMSGASAAFSA